MTPAPTTPASMALALLVLAVHRATLASLAIDRERELRTVLAMGVSALDRVDAAIRSGRPEQLRELLDVEQRRMLERAEHANPDGWHTTGYAWALYALERVHRAVRGVTDPAALGLLPGQSRPHPVAPTVEACR